MHTRVRASSVLFCACAAASLCSAEEEEFFSTERSPRWRWREGERVKQEDFGCPVVDVTTESLLLDWWQVESQ